jgi:ketosteroid isomerase-like protein
LSRLERIQRIYDAVVAGDLDRVMTDAMEQIEWRNPPDAIEPGTRQGRADFAQAVEAISAEFKLERIEILNSAERGDTVALMVRTTGTGKTSGAPIDSVFSHVFWFDGESVAAFEWSRDPQAALRAVGADRWPGDAAGS